MYFDTLKVSTLEQSASETSARGGVGNPNLITWNYDKEITINLEDALYSPASQSLMWGGLFGVGKQKIYGAWDPYIYDKDGLGRNIYVKKKVITEEEYNALTDDKKTGYIKFICPCDETIKYMTYEQTDGYYKYASQETDKSKIYQTGAYKGCFKGSPYKTSNSITTVKNRGKIINEEITTYSTHSENGEVQEETNENIYVPTIYTCSDLMNHPARPEKAELIIDAFGDFDYGAIQYGSLKNSVSDEKVTSHEVELCNKVSGLKLKDCSDSEIDELEYKWLDTDVKMVSLEGDQDIYYGNNMSIRYRTPIDQSEKVIMISQRRLYDSARQEVVQYKDDELKAENGRGIHWEYDPYDSKINFYINLNWGLCGETGDLVNHYTRVLVGTFYIVESLNYNNNTMTDMIHPIDYGIKDVYYFDRTEKCVAPRTFCINADRNLRMEQLRQLPQYAQAEMTVYINPKTMKPYESNTDHFHKRNGDVVYGNLTIIKQDSVYYKWTRRRAPKYMSLGRQIIVDAVHFPGTYRLVGETYSRAREDGKDQRYQFEIPLCKMSPNTNLTLQADGDPTTFTMEMKVMQRDDGVMMKLTQYDVENAVYESYCSDSHEIVPTDALFIEDDCNEVIDDEEPSVEEIWTLQSINIDNPDTGSVYCVPGDCQAPYGNNETGSSPAYLIIQGDLTGLDRSKLVVSGLFTSNQGRQERRILTDYDVELKAGNTTGG